MELSKEEVLEEQRKLFGWIPLARYLDMFPEETASGIRQRRRRGFWITGVHVSITPGMGTWVHLQAIKDLIEHDPLKYQRGSAPTLVGEAV